MNVDKYFPHFITVALLGTGIWQRSGSFALAAVASLGLILVRYWLESKAIVAAKPGLPEETKRLMQDLSARVTTIEYGIKTRGF